ncbi:Rpn family recombination-promoting nuclease/putative transposase [Prevotella copri]|uniref:Rpn family recombination-promoting nuclease/putative transposase n=2 Tax=Segatella copri TaxID=165179 RepID=A0AA90UFV6_9BACT|nr:Rpn family recombination-promoting nuclease/putative transposase [Segatella copri]
MVMKYLDPKADLTFKKIFGNHPKRLISLLNALLPLSEEEQIHEIKYLPTELVPENNSYRYAITNILCTDAKSNKFCVVIRIEWSDAFQQRVQFLASELYVNPAIKQVKYFAQYPTYSLNLINDIFAHDTPDFIHNYRIVHDKDSNKVIEGLHFTFIELPKFTPHSIADKRMMVLWLRFLTEINSDTKEIPADLLNDPEIGKAVEELEISGFSDAELWAYDKFWDSVSVERTLIDDSYQKGIEKGIEKSMNQRSLEIARKMLAKGMDDAMVMDMTGLTAEEIKQMKL